MDHPPTGTVTFLFTDIEGSTKLWQEHSDMMSWALSRHHMLLNNSIIANSGYVFQIIGDAFCAAFSTAIDGLRAALVAQRALAAEKWGETGPIRVRMALHSGGAEVREGEYTSGEYISSLTLSRTARLLSAGHGGQILLSMPAAELVRDQLPIGMTLRNLGSHRLKDLVRSEQIYQAVTADLPTEFPALKTLDTRPQNLPLQLTSFIGREQEITDIQALLEKTTPATRLLTLTGPGGTGKTRLALQTGADLIDNFPEGAWFVDLAPLTDAELVPQAMAAVWELREQPWRPLSEVLSDYLCTKKLLIILDNCEHLVEACARLCQAILQTAEGVKILATSREPLGVPGEVLYRVPTLSLPDAKIPPTPKALSQSEAVRLFIDRAIIAHPDFAVTNANASSVAQICQRLDGIPLAIELAAARLRAFSIEQIADRLEDCFRLLTSGSRTSLPRHQTLRALIDWSYNLLTEEEGLLFQRLATFSGGWSLEAAEAACSGEGIDRNDIFDLMAHLVDRSLVTVEEQEEQPRYRLLETLRQYAAQALKENGQQTYWQGRHLEYYLNLAEEVAPQLRSAEDIVGMERLTRENDNLRAAFETAVQAENTKVMLRLSGALYYFWHRSGRIQEGMNRTLQAIRMPNTEQHPMELANALLGLGGFYWLSGSYQNALESLHQSVELAYTVGNPGKYVLASALYWRGFTHMRLLDFVSAKQDAENSRVLAQEIHDAYGLGFSNYALGRIFTEQGNFQAAQPYLEQAIKWSRTAGDRFLIALVLNEQVLIAISNGDYVSAQALNQESLKLARQINEVWLTSGRLREAGNLAQVMGDYSTARNYFLESGEIIRQQGLLNDYARNRFNLGVVAILQGDLNSGRAYLRESWDLFDQLNLRRGQVECIDGFALLAAAAGQSELAACLIGLSDAEFQSLGVIRWLVDQNEYDKLRARLAENLGVKIFNNQYENGQKLGLNKGFELAAGIEG